MPANAIAIDLGGTNLRVARVSADAVVEERARAATPQGTADEVLDALATLAEPLANGETVGIGLGFPGFLDLSQGRVVTAPNLSDWEGLDLSRALQERLHLEVHLENDANAAALGEHWAGAAQGTRHFCQITLGTGLGAGLFLNGEIHHGARGMAGELGHIPSALRRGFQCGCGQYGCLETVASATGFRNLAADAWKSGKGTDSPLHQATGGDATALNVAKAAVLARGGNAFAQRLFEEMGTELGLGLAFVANTLNVECVVIAGGVSAAWDLFSDTTHASLRQHVLPGLLECMDLRPTQLKDDAGLLGAARLALGL